jgi:hypothetical protein
MFSVLQMLLALVAIACVVLTEPRNLEPNGPRYYLVNPYNPTVIIASNTPRERPIPLSFFLRPAVLPIAASPAVPPPGSAPADPVAGG